MKYRIKIITFKNGRKEYYTQVRKFILWIGIALDGELGYNTGLRSRELALGVIDLHYDGNYKKQTIEFEYINKQQ